ncbi:ArnT family glycosyltransferase [Halobacillus mangrovi]|nr:glycosyltransferase family 39 protein [Halobacillus mangrovi]
MTAFNKYFKAFCVLTILLVGAIYMGYGFYVNVEQLDDFYDWPSFFIVAAGLLVMGIAYAVTRLPIPRVYYVSGMLILAFLLRLLWVLFVPTEPESDFLTLHNAALSVTEGDFSFTENSYFQKWVYQLGFVMYQALIIFLFGEDIFILQFFNILFSVAMVWMVYKITTEIFEEKAGHLAGLIYTFYIPAIVMTSLLTNQILATLLFYIGAYLLVKRFEDKNWSWIAIGVLFALGHIIRPLGSFVLLAAGIFVFVVYLLRNNRRNILINSGKFLGVITTYLLVLTIASQTLIISGISDYPLENRDPKWKFVVGLNHETRGTYSNEGSKTLSNLSWKERLAKEEEMIEERLSDPSRLPPLFHDKFSIMWGDRDASIMWSYQGDDEDFKDWLYKTDKFIYLQFFIFGMIAIFGLIKSAKGNLENKQQKALFFVLFIIGYAMIHLLIEIQTRYRFVLMPGLITLQSYGVYVLHRLFIRSKKRESIRKSSAS